MNHQDIQERISELKKERKAVILVHNYQRGEVQDIADYIGDSLGLSQEAARTEAEVIIFCGVHFMAETAAILNPEKIVILPDITAGCPMAEMVDPADLREKQQELKGMTTVAYVNTTAATKALVDICCTSANALQVVKSLPDKEVLFIPDKYLGTYVASKLPQKKLHLWNGFCPTHVRITKEDVEEQKTKHPQAKVIVHPECLPEVTALADEVGSTGKIVSYARESEAKEIIVGTEIGILHRLKKENPEKEFYPASDKAICPNMKKITLEKVLWALEDLKPRVEVDSATQNKALQTIEKMLQIT